MKRSSQQTDDFATTIPATSGWDVGRLSRALHAMPTMTHDPGFGQGIRYRLGQHDALVVDLFPPTTARGHGIVRLATADLDLMLFKQGFPAIADDGVLFQTTDVVILLHASGDLRLFRATE